MFNRIANVAAIVTTFTLLGSVTKVRADNEEEPAAGTEQYVRQALAKTVSIDVTDKPLDEVAKELGEQAKVAVDIDRRALVAERLDVNDMKVTVTLKEIPLRSCLRIILRDLDLTFMVDEEILRITTTDDARRYQKAVILDVSGLLDVEAAASSNGGSVDYDSLIELITTTIAPTAWEVSDPAPLFGFRGTLVIRQTDDVVDQICQLLTAIRKGKQITDKHGDSLPPVISIGADHNTRACKRIQTAMDSKADIEFKDAPLRDVVEFLHTKYQINIHLDQEELASHETGLKTKVTFDARNMTLGRALRRWLNDVDLAYFVFEGVLFISTAEAAQYENSIRVYPVQDLVEPIPWESQLAWGVGSVGDRQVYDYDSLMELTTLSVALTDWDEVGGTGSAYPLEAYGLIVVSQTEENHRRLAKFYENLRKTIPAVAKKPLEKPADDELRTAVYSVPGTPWGVTGNERVHVNPSEREVLKLITSIIEPDSWRKRDDVYAHAIKERLVIRHTNAVHRKIYELATKLEIWGFRETGVYKSDGCCVSVIPIVGDKQLVPAKTEQPKQEATP